MWAMWWACASSPTDGPSGTSSGTEGADPPALVEVDVVAGSEPVFSLADGYFAWEARFADVDGDGATDLVVGLDHYLRGYTAVVYGPIGPVELPADADVLVEATVEVGELDGQAPLDFVYDGWLIPGPWDGSLTPQASWVRLYDPLDYPLEESRLLDVDADGILDRVGFPDHGTPAASITVTYGPADRWAGPPDATVHPPCREFYATDDHPRSTSYLAPGDLDGDGAPELSVGPYGFYDGVDCGGFTVSLGGGPVDPWVDGWDGLVATALPLGDVDGDGGTDWLDAAAWAAPDAEELFGVAPGPSRLLLSPIAVAAGGLDGARAVAADPALSRATVLPLDRGQGTALIVGWVGAAFLLLDPESYAEIADGTIAYTGDHILHGSYVADGRGYVTFYTFDGELRRIDVGPATEL